MLDCTLQLLPLLFQLSNGLTGELTPVRFLLFNAYTIKNHYYFVALGAAQ